jgi:hypothetical protein
MSEFNAGNVVSRSFSVWGKNLVPFTAMSLLVFAPLYAFLALLSRWSTSLVSMGLIRIGGQLGGSLLGLIVIGGVTYGVLQDLRGRHVTMAQSLRVGLGRMFPILWLAIISGVAILGACCFAVVPGVIVATMFCLAVPVSIVERPGGAIASLKRSIDLTEGHRLSIFAILLIFGFFNLFILVVLEAVLPTPERSTMTWAVYLAVTLIAQSLLNSLGAVGCSVAYHDLRIAKEGISTEALAAVFD